MSSMTTFVICTMTALTIVIADSVVLDEAAGAWFAGVAERVTAGLEACGYARCNGDVMASNPAWRKTVAQWRRQFAHWVNEPDPDAVMHCQIFFDARTVHGDPSLLAEVRQDVLAATPASKRFLGQLATQAVERQPPVGFFRGFVLARRGEEHDSFDLKGNGVHAIIEIARVHALAHGLDQVGTLERLHTLSRLTESQSFEELADAFEFVSHVRLAHQARQMATTSPCRRGRCGTGHRPALPRPPPRPSSCGCWRSTWRPPGWTRPPTGC